MYKVYRFLSGFAFLASVATAQAQNLGNSPYSATGVGDINESTGSVRSFGMGNVGVGTPASAYINSSNPALLYYNNRVTFEMGIGGQAKQLSDEVGKQRDADGSLNYLGLALPLSKRWSTAIGLRPFSTVNYEYVSEGAVNGDPSTKIVNSYTGNGNLSEVFFGHGIRVAKRLNIGVSASYLFGAVERESTAQLVNESDVSLSAERLVISERSNYNGLLFKGALAYRQPLSKKWSLNVGTVYTLGNDLTTKRRTVQERRLASDLVLSRNYLGDSITTTTHLPQGIQFGLSVDNGQSLVVGADFSAQKWSDYKSGLSTEKLADSYRVAVGAEYIPNPASINSYFQRIGYRAGFGIGKTPLELNGKQVNDVSLHWGFTLPIGGSPRPPEYTQSLLNLGFAIGRRSNGESSTLQEKYFRIQLGFSLNSNWFIKPKID
ncbi:hypothetical protein AHMF7605_19895 [Adhaeribacter arboris]|uniref:Aromatic hydrocarbon degradation protein n=1 Tax=Adhaeribacter arboris TaxID=2072846 RepID=A0A2T2YJC6_9BACT|nr:hypothetical protein [Adhaeribacter arboris]PSR55607.1 hypothetical protein AHMF7605_19895 [Adhaeribacter arboris]